MDDVDLKPSFEGANEERLLCALFDRIRRPPNDAQRAFCDAWNATRLLNGDGFEMLLEQDKPLREFADAFLKIGRSRVKPIFDRVITLVFMHSLFEDLTLLLYEFFDVTKDIVPAISN